MWVRAAQRVAPEHPGPRGRSSTRSRPHLRDRVVAQQAFADLADAERRSQCGDAHRAPRRGGRRRRSSRSPCSGRRSRRAPRAPRPRTGRDPLEQVGDGDDEPGRAEAALDGTRFDERRLHRMQVVAPGETLDGDDLVAIHLRRQNEAGAHELAVEDDRARAALALLARVLRPGSSSVSRSIVRRLSPPQTSASSRAPFTVTETRWLTSAGTSRAHAWRARAARGGDRRRCPERRRSGSQPRRPDRAASRPPREAP